MIKSLLSVSLLSLLLISTSFSKDLNYKEKLSYVKERVDLYFFPQMGLKQKVSAVNYAYNFVKDNPNYVGKEWPYIINRIELVNSEFWSEKIATALYHNVVKIHFTGKYLDKLADKLLDLKAVRVYINTSLSMIEVRYPKSKLKRRGDVIRTNYIPNSAYHYYLDQFLSFENMIPANTRIIIKEKFGLYEKPTFQYFKGNQEGEKGIVKFTIGIDIFNWEKGQQYSYELFETLTRLSLGHQINISSFMLKPDIYIEAVQNLKSALTVERSGRLYEAGIKKIEIMENWEDQDDLIQYGTLIVGVKQEDIEFIIDTLFP